MASNLDGKGVQTRIFEWNADCVGWFWKTWNRETRGGSEETGRTHLETGYLL